MSSIFTNITQLHIEFIAKLFAKFFTNYSIIIITVIL